MKLHWQVSDFKIGINGSTPEYPRLAICGAMWPIFANDKKEITCKKCLKRLEKDKLDERRLA